MKNKLFATLILLLAATTLYIAKTKIKVIKVGKLIDEETGKILLNQMILIENNIIKNIGDNSIVGPNPIRYL